VSAATHYTSGVDIVMAVHSFVLVLIFYLWVSTFVIEESNYNELSNFFYFIVYSQLVFSFIKFFLVGVDEYYLIGTMSHQAGQLSFLFPAIVIPLVVFIEREYKHALFLIFLLMLFSIIGEKRSAVFVLPVVMIFSYVFINGGFNYKGLKLFNIIPIILVSLTILYLGIKFIPSLNEEEVSGGDVSLGYAINYAKDYLTMDGSSKLQSNFTEIAVNTNVQYGRITLLLKICEWLRLNDLNTLFFGIGYGLATPNEWIVEGRDNLFNVTGLRGAVSGFGLVLVETGVVGAMLVSYLFFYLFFKLVNEWRRAKSNSVRRWFKTLISINFVFLFDFYFYSMSLLRTFPLPLIFSGLVASIFIAKRLDKKIARRNHASTMY